MACSMLRAGGQLGRALEQPDLFFVLNPCSQSTAKTCSSCPRAPARSVPLCPDTPFGLRLCWWPSQKLSRQHLYYLRLRSQAISACAARTICRGSPDWAAGVHGEAGGPDGWERSVIVKISPLPRCAWELGRVAPSEPAPGMRGATLMARNTQPCPLTYLCRGFSTEAV